MMKNMSLAWTWTRPRTVYKQCSLSVNELSWWAWQNCLTYISILFSFLKTKSSDDPQRILKKTNVHSLALYLLYCRFDVGFLEVFKVEKQIRSTFDDEDNIIFDLTTTSNNHYRRVPRRKWTGSRSAFVYILHNIVKGITGRWFHVIILVFNDARNRRKNLRPLSGSFHWHQIHSVKNAWIQLEIGARDFFVPAPLALGASSSLSSNQTFLTFFFLNKWGDEIEKTCDRSGPSGLRHGW